jgi:hypothetical protein
MHPRQGTVDCSSSSTERTSKVRWVKKELDLTLAQAGEYIIVNKVVAGKSEIWEGYRQCMKGLLPG